MVKEVIANAVRRSSPLCHQVDDSVLIPMNVDQVTVGVRSLALVDGLSILLKHHRASDNVQSSLRENVISYLDVSTESVWLKKAKYLLSYPFAKYLRNELPECPQDGPFVPKGALRDFMKARLVNYCRKNTHFWYSWLQGKRSTLPSGDELILENYVKHLKVLTNPDTGDQEVIDRIMSNPDFLAHLDKIRAKVINSYLFDQENRPGESIPSLSACLDRTRSEGGTCDSLNSKVFGDKYYTRFLSSHRDLVSMSYSPKAIQGNRVRSNVVIPVYTRDLDLLDEWKSFTPSFGDDNLTAKIQGILEPMKVRIISKGPSFEYYFCKPLQKVIHSALRDMDSYRLIGRPLSPTDLLDVSYPYTQHNLYQGGDGCLTDQWISVDYSAATDNLSWKYSGRIFEYIIQDLPPSLVSVARQVLGPHYLTYPHPSMKHINTRMERGQLMGSILSFPILCLANMGLYLDVTKESQKNWTLEEREQGVLINGDDQLYIGSPETFKEHIQTGLKVGLEMSVGKAYIHPSYTNVNSTCVDMDLRSKHSNPWQIDFLNTGLFIGRHKVMERVGEVSEENNRPNIVPVLNLVLQGSLPGRQSDLLKAWFNFHGANKIREDTRANTKRGIHFRNLFIPIALGGMGIRCPLGFKFYITKQDKKFASLVYREKFKFSTTNLPLRYGQGPSVDSTIIQPFNVVSKQCERVIKGSIHKMVPSRFLRDRSSLIQDWFLDLPPGVALCA